jgi:cytoskeletal protein RodZ
MLDMWGSTDKLNGNNRHSTMSDMISAFPAPAVGGTPTIRRDGAWPLGEKGDAYASTSDLSKGQPTKKRRKCCGLSLPIFFTVLVVIIILIAAAVLIPIFLILVPKQHAKDNTCASSHLCQNGGTSIVSQNTCVCVCSNGFTGSQCETPGNAQDCMTSTVRDGANEYKNATMGSSVVPALSDAQNQFNIPLNVSTILALFSTNNLSCTSENSLLDFNSTSESTKTRRFVIIPGLEPPSNGFASVDESPAAPLVSKRTEPVGKLQLERRQDGATVGTSNGIVFQATSATSIGAVSTPSASIGTDVSTITSISGTASATAASDSGSSAPSVTSDGNTSSPSSTVTDEDAGFARVVVLYVIQQSQTMDVAVKAQEQLESFFQQQTQGNSSTTVQVGEGNQRFTADFDALSITMGNGQVIGGKSKD